MVDRTKVDFGRRARHLRVDTLVRLRWLAVVGQLAAVLFVHTALDFALPIDLCVGAIAASACLNAGLRFAFPRTHRLADGPAAALLGFDIFQLCVLLSLTGGIENPFVFLALAPVMISAVSLPWRLTAVLLTFMAASSLVLVRVHLPLPWHADQRFELPLIYRFGMWGSLCLGGGFVCIYAGRVAHEARRLGDALAATEFALVREQHLIQLDGLAAAAAHELGTPLATITLVVKEILRHPERAVSRDDIEVLAQQSARCRDILGTLTSLGSDSGGIIDDLTTAVLVEESVAPHRNFGVAVEVALSGDAPEPRTRRNPGMLYGLGNLIENAVDFAETRVDVRVEWNASTVSIMIADDGAGFSPDVLIQAGEPYLTTRGDARKTKVDETAGLGLGLFIAKTLLERSGAALTLDNAAAPDHGARIRIDWPRSAFDSGASADTRPDVVRAA